MFKGLIGKTMKVYIDGMLVKFIKADDHLEHLRKTFDVLEKYQMRLNPTKCNLCSFIGKVSRTSSHTLGDRSKPLPDQSTAKHAIH